MFGQTQGQRSGEGAAGLVRLVRHDRLQHLARVGFWMTREREEDDPPAPAKHPNGVPAEPASSGFGSDSALDALIRKRPRSPVVPEPTPEPTHGS